VTGEEKERLGRRLIKAYREKQIACSPGNVKPLPKTYGKRGAKTLEMMKPFFEEMRVDIDQYINEGSCNFYGAPVAILICLDDSFPKARMVDIGLALGYLVLTAHEFGLVTCPIGLIVAYEDEITTYQYQIKCIGVALVIRIGTAPSTDLNFRFELSKFIRWIE
jgi:nitroreductase